MSDTQNGSIKRYRVTVYVEDGRPDWTCVVAATRVGQAETLAMFGYPHRLNGAVVGYTVTETDAPVDDWFVALEARKAAWTPPVAS